MIAIHPQYIIHSDGSKFVVLPESEFESLMEEIEDAEDEKLYEDAMKDDTGERIPMNEAFEQIEEERKKVFG